MWWLGVGGLAEGLQDLKGPASQPLCFCSNHPLGPRPGLEPVSSSPSTFALETELNLRVCEPAGQFPGCPSAGPVLAEKPGSSSSPGS